MYKQTVTLAPNVPLVPIGSLIKTSSKFGHELIAGPLIDGCQVVLHKEPGKGTRVEAIDSAAQRYQFTEIQTPVSDYHGAAALWRVEQRLGEPWAALDNCQHTARGAYYGVPDSPTVNVMAGAAGFLLLLWLANENRGHG